MEGMLGMWKDGLGRARTGRRWPHLFSGNAGRKFQEKLKPPTDRAGSPPVGCPEDALEEWPTHLSLIRNNRLQPAEAHELAAGEQGSVRSADAGFAQGEVAAALRGQPIQLTRGEASFGAYQQRSSLRGLDGQAIGTGMRDEREFAGVGRAPGGEG